MNDNFLSRGKEVKAMDETLLKQIIECIDMNFEIFLKPESCLEKFLSEKEIDKRAAQIKTVLTLYVFNYIDAKREMCKKTIAEYKTLVETLRKEERK